MIFEDTLQETIELELISNWTTNGWEKAMGDPEQVVVATIINHPNIPYTQARERIEQAYKSIDAYRKDRVTQRI